MSTAEGGQAASLERAVVVLITPIIANSNRLVLTHRHPHPTPPTLPTLLAVVADIITTPINNTIREALMLNGVVGVLEGTTHPLGCEVATTTTTLQMVVVTGGMGVAVWAVQPTPLQPEVGEVAAGYWVWPPHPHPTTTNSLNNPQAAIPPTQHPATRLEAATVAVEEEERVAATIIPTMVAAANTKMPTNNNIAARPLPAISTPPQVVDTQTTPTHRTTITTPINNSSDHHTVVTQITTTTTTVVGMTAIKLREVAVVDLSNPPSTPTPNSSQAVRLILLQEVGQVAVAEVGSKFEEEEGQVAAVDTAEEEVVVETKNHYLFFSSFLLSPITTVQPLSL
jgi:hypothetical protein